MTGSRIVTIFVQVNANHSVTPAMMFYRGATACALAQLLEEAGYQTEIMQYSFSMHAFKNGDDLMQTAWIKRSEESVSLPDLANATSAWLRRTIGFMAYDLWTHSPASSGRGAACIPLLPIFDRTCGDVARSWVIDSTFCLTWRCRKRRNC